MPIDRVSAPARGTEVLKAAAPLFLTSGARLMGVHVIGHVVVWVVTEAASRGGNRASTRLLFPEEY